MLLPFKKKDPHFSIIIFHGWLQTVAYIVCVCVRLVLICLPRVTGGNSRFSPYSHCLYATLMLKSFCLEKKMLFVVHCCCVHCIHVFKCLPCKCMPKLAACIHVICYTPNLCLLANSPTHDHMNALYMTLCTNHSHRQCARVYSLYTQLLQQHHEWTMLLELMYYSTTVLLTR
jgi:hypothetical protein